MPKKFERCVGGRPSGLTQEVADRILSVLPESFTQRQVARLAKVRQQRLSDWLKWGDEDLENDVESIYATFAVNYEEKKGKIIKESLLKLKEQNSFQAISWLLEKCFPEEFGKDCEQMKEIISIVNNLTDKGSPLNSI